MRAAAGGKAGVGQVIYAQRVMGAANKMRGAGWAWDGMHRVWVCVELVLMLYATRQPLELYAFMPVWLGYGCFACTATKYSRLLETCIR